jgi:hypothetical protein
MGFRMFLPDSQEISQPAGPGSPTGEYTCLQAARTTKDLDFTVRVAPAGPGAVLLKQLQDVGAVDAGAFLTFRVPLEEGAPCCLKEHVPNPMHKGKRTLG